MVILTNRYLIFLYFTVNFDLRFNSWLDILIFETSLGNRSYRENLASFKLV